MNNILRMKLTRQQELTIKEFGDYSLIKRPDASFILHKKDMPSDLNKLWQFKSWRKIFRFWSDKYLASYFEGNWGDFDDTKLNELELLKQGKIKNLYRGCPSNDGFLWKEDRMPLLRKIKCEFWESYYSDLNALKTELQKHKQWSNFIIEDVPYYNVDISGNKNLHASYLPDQNELNQWVTRKIANPTCGFEGSYGLIHDFPYIKKYKNV